MVEADKNLPNESQPITMVTQTKSQKKNQKRKQKKREEKESKFKEESGTQEEKEVQELENFEKELEWCVLQLQIGLIDNEVNAEQLKESKSIINSLTSGSTSIVKKRHLMHVVFGDYRKKMKEPKYFIPPSKLQKLKSSKQVQVITNTDEREKHKDDVEIKEKKITENAE